MRVLDLFSGIGGFSLGLERAGMETVGFCEINQYCQKVLRKHWASVPIYSDITELTVERLNQDGITADVVCGGYPCQPFSHAGKRNGEKDDRHLWPEMLRIIEGVRPKWIITENVIGHISMGLDQVLSDLEAIDYTWWTFVIPACAIGARSRRDRIWTVANSMRHRLQRGETNTKIRQKNVKAGNEQLAGLLQPCPWPSLSESRNCGEGDGIPNRVDRNKAIGNAVVPQIPELIGHAIMSFEA